MVKEATIIDEADAAGGEFEIERIPTRVIQARSKHLIPVFEYLQAPKVQQTRYGDFFPAILPNYVTDHT